MPIKQMHWYGNGWVSVNSGGNVGSCCGSKYLPKESKPRKWKNGHGEGITVPKKVDPVTDNTKGILVVDGKVGDDGIHGKVIVTHLKTKNGPMTISIRKEW